VSASKTKKSRFWLAFFLDDLEVGQEFKPGLLHLTIITWSVSDLSDQEVIESFDKFFNSCRAFSIKIGERTKFGSDREVLVNLVEPSDELLGLHRAALNWFSNVNGRWAVKNPHAGEDYKPHIRRRPGTKLQPGVININHIYLIIAKRQEDEVRRVAAKVDFDE